MTEHNRQICGWDMRAIELFISIQNFVFLLNLSFSKTKWLFWLKTMKRPINKWTFKVKESMEITYWVSCVFNKMIKSVQAKFYHHMTEMNMSEHYTTNSNKIFLNKLLYSILKKRWICVFNTHSHTNSFLLSIYT